MIKLTRLFCKQFLQLNPPLNVGEVKVLVIPVSSLGLKGDKAHGLTDEDKLFCLNGGLSG